MKYTILINQNAVVTAGFHTKTDLIDWAILDYIDSWQKSSKATRIDGYVWLNYKHLIQEMPLLGLRAKQSVSDRIGKLRGLNLLESIQPDGDGRLYVRTTELFFDITQFSTESNPIQIDGQGVRSDGQGVRSDGQGVRSDGQGVRSDGHSINNQNKQSKQHIKTNNNNNSETINLNNHAVNAHELLLSLDLKVKESESISHTEEKAERQKEMVKFPIFENFNLTESEKAEVNKKLASLSQGQRDIAIQAISSAVMEDDIVYIRNILARGMRGELKPFKKRNNVTPTPTQETLFTPVSGENNAANEEDSRKETEMEVLKLRIAKYKDKMLAEYKQKRAVFIQGLGVFYQDDLAAAGLFD